MNSGVPRFQMHAGVAPRPFQVPRSRSQTRTGPQCEASRAHTATATEHVAPPTAIRDCCVGCSELERAALEVSQLVWYGGSSVGFQEQGKEWHPAQHQIIGAYVQDRSRGQLVQLGGVIYGPSCRHLSSSKVKKHQMGLYVIDSSGPRAQVLFLGSLPFR